MTEAGLTQAELFDVFSNARRRRTVQFLKRQHGSCDLTPLVEQVAAWENDTSPNQVTRAQRRRVYISLYQTHLPMLEDHGIIDWDADGHRIELLPGEEAFDPYLERSNAGQRSWHLFYAAVIVLGAVSFTLSVLEVGPLTAAEAPTVTLVLCAFVLLVALAQHASRRPGQLLSRVSSHR